MQKFFQKSGASLLALLVLLSTVSFTVDKHFCGEMLVDTAVFSEAHDCGMGMDGMDEDSCCKDEKLLVEGQDELKRSFENLDLQQQLFLTTFSYSYLDIFEILPGHRISFREYVPPLLVQDIHLLDQVFLI